MRHVHLGERSPEEKGTAFGGEPWEKGVLGSQRTHQRGGVLGFTAESFFKKKVNKDQEPRTICWRTAPTWESEARRSLAWRKAESSMSDQRRDFPEPFRVLVRGART